MGSSQPHNHDHGHGHDAHHDPTPAANTGPDCGPDSDPIKRFITLVRGGMTIQTAADTVGIPHYLAYRTAHHHGRAAAHTTRRCDYLKLRINALSRKDALAALGLHESSGRDFDRGVTKTAHGLRPFIPSGPDAFLYKRLMQLMPYVDGRVAVPVQVIPQHRIDQRIHAKFLSIKEREIIADLKNHGHSIRAIARHLGRAPSTISKELARHTDEFGLYKPQHAHRLSVLKRFRPKQRKIDAHPALGEAIWQMLGQRLSPEQIAGRLRRLHPDDQTMWVCTETIYQALFIQAKGELKHHIKACLRQGRAVRKPRGLTRARQRFHDPMIMISDRLSSAVFL